MALIINVDGSTQDLKGDNPDGTLSLAQCQKAVGGYIERVVLHGPIGDLGKELIADEEGLLKPDPVVNPIASAIAGQPIVGTVILVKIDGANWR